MKKVLSIARLLHHTAKGLTRVGKGVFATIKRFHGMTIRQIFPFALGAIVILIPVVFLILKTPGSVSAAWYSSNWGFRKKMVIDYTKVSGSADLTSFPVLVSVTDADLKSLAQSDGDDIMFTLSDGTTKLDHEIEKYTSATGQLVAWVRIPTLTYATDTEIYMYYGNPSVSSQQNKTGVWDASYVGVWHLSETSGNHANSTSVTGLTQDYGSVTQQGANIGKADGADDFNGSTDTVGFPHVADMLPSGDITVESWSKLDTLPSVKGASEVIVSKNVTGSPYESYYMFISSADNKVRFYWKNDSSTTFAARYDTAITTGTWMYNVGVHDSSVLRFYYNGSATGTVTSSPTGTVYATNPVRFWMGSDATTNKFDGVIDEIRVSNIARSAGWLATTYNTINSPSSFFKSTSVAQKGPTTPVLYWAFNEETGSSVYDSSGMGNTGTLGTGSSAPAWELDIVPYGNGGNGSSSLKFDGSGDYVSKSYSNDTELDVGTAGFSVSGWFHHSSTVSGTDTILSRYSSGGYKVYMNSSGYVCFGIDSDATWTPSHTACSSTSYADSKWHHFEAVKTGTSTITLYIDGLQIQQTSITDTATLSGSSPTLYVGVDSN
ncbi:MAG: DUF2341 domain-containing protein, partial [Patescibacteria group bacterium]